MIWSEGSRWGFITRKEKKSPNFTPSEEWRAGELSLLSCCKYLSQKRKKPELHAC